MYYTCICVLESRCALIIIRAQFCWIQFRPQHLFNSKCTVLQQCIVHVCMNTDRDNELLTSCTGNLWTQWPWLLAREARRTTSLKTSRERYRSCWLPAVSMLSAASTLVAMAAYTYEPSQAQQFLKHFPIGSFIVDCSLRRIWSQITGKKVRGTMVGLSGNSPKEPIGKCFEELEVHVCS